MDEKRINLKAIQKAFGVSDKSVRNWIDAGMPCDKTKKGYHFILSACIQWREAYLQSMKKGSDEFEKAKTEREVYRAKMAKLNYEKMAGTLILAQEVKDLMFSTARLTRDSILNIPGRLSALLANQTRDKIHEMLTHELRQALENLANKFCDLESVETILKESEVKNEVSPN